MPPTRSKKSSSRTKRPARRIQMGGVDTPTAAATVATAATAVTPIAVATAGTPTAGTPTAGTPIAVTPTAAATAVTPTAAATAGTPTAAATAVTPTAAATAVTPTAAATAVTPIAATAVTPTAATAVTPIAATAVTPTAATAGIFTYAGPQTLRKQADFTNVLLTFENMFADVPTGNTLSKQDTTYKVGDKDGLSAVDAAIHMSLCCYRAVFDKIAANTAMDASKFITQLEANREYHARCCAVLALLDDATIIPGLEAITLQNMDLLRVFIHGESRKLSAYDLMYLVTPMMVQIALWENTKTPVDAKYVGELVKSDPSLPSHIRLLGDLLGNKPENFHVHYPGSLMMNYANFYPLVLYPTGKPPTP